MTLLAGLSAGVFVYLALGTLVGITPRWLHRQTDDRRLSAGWRDWLRQSGADISPLQLVLASLAGSLVVATAIYGAVGVGSLAVVGGGLMLGAPRAVLSRRRRQISRARLEAWPDALRDLVTHLRASMSIHAGLAELGRSGPRPLRPAFNRYAGLAGALDYKSALEVVRDDLADPLSDRIIEILLVAFEQGSSLVIDILSDLAESTTHDLRLEEEIETAKLETKLEARGASVLPFVVLGLLCATSSEYKDFYTSPAGWFVVCLGGAMALVGLFVIARLGRVAGEERILAEVGR